MSNTSFAPETLTAIAELATSFCKLDADRSLNLHKFMSAVGDSPTYDNWMAARGAWIQGYMIAKPKASEDAQNMAWSRYLNALRVYAGEEGFDFTIPEKPKATTAAAEKQREKRANEFVSLSKSELVDTVETLAQAVSEAPAMERGQHAAKLIKAQEALSKIERAEAKAAEKAANADKVARLKAINEFVKGAGGDVLVLVEAVITANDEHSGDDAKTRAWEMLAAVSLGALGLKMPKRKA